MSEVTITVRGEHDVRVAPERATLQLSVSSDGPDRAEVVERTLALAAPVRESIVLRHNTGGLVDWSSRRLNVSADRPWSADGRQLAPVYHATVEFSATFADPSELSLWATEISAWDGVTIGATDWHLTPETEASIEREVATQAVSVAIARAEAYARALGLHDVTAVEIADRGLIATGPAPLREKALRAAAFDALSAPPMEFHGDDIVVSASVEARFIAR